MSIDQSQAALAMLEDFCVAHQLSADFAATARDHYLPFIQSLLHGRSKPTYVVGVSGAQGSGKSTLADLIAAYATQSGLNVAAFSLDDFYLTRKERQQLAEKVHPLLLTRGVPGTHDTRMLAATFAGLRDLEFGQTMALPRFDKLADDRLPRDCWSSVSGPIDLIVFEGWCVGAVPQSAPAMAKPINTLEENEDPSGRWRNWVNDQLAEHYQSLWKQINLLAFLHAPDFDSVLNWREEQEGRLVRQANSNKTAMTRQQLQRFIQHYQRITQSNLDNLPGIADVVFWLDRSHQITNVQYAHVSVSP